MAAASELGKFDPEKHRANVYDAFMEYVEAFQYEYDAIARDPPSDETDKTHGLNSINARYSSVDIHQGAVRRTMKIM